MPCDNCMVLITDEVVVFLPQVLTNIVLAYTPKQCPAIVRELPCLVHREKHDGKYCHCMENIAI